MKNIIQFLLFSVFLFQSSPSFSAALSLDEAIGLAIKNNEDIQIAYLDITKMDELLREIESILYPQFSGSLSYSASQIDSKDRGSSQTSSGIMNFNAGVEASQLLYAFGTIQKSIEAAKLSKKMTIEQKELSILQVIYSVKTAYYGALVAEEQLAVAQESYKNAVNSKNLLERSASVRSSQSDLIKVSADIASRKPEVESAIIARKQSLRLIQILCGINEPITELATKFNVKKFIPLNEVSIIEKLDNASNIKAIQTQIEVYMKQADLSLAQNNPTINLFGSLSFDSESPNATLYDPNNQGVGAIGVMMNIPIFDGGKNRAASKQYKIDAYKSISKLNQTRRYLTKDLTDAIENYYTYISILALDDEAVMLAERSYKLSLSRFINGQTSAVELNDVERSLSSLKSKRLSTINTIYSSLAKIEQIVGDL